MGKQLAGWPQQEDDDEADSEPNFRQAERTRRGPSSSSLLQNGSFHHLAQVFKSKSELSCAARLGTIRFWMTNHWVKRIMADTSPVSFYSTRPYSVFFSNLVSENPYLIDYLLHASEGDLDQAKVSSSVMVTLLLFTSTPVAWPRPIGAKTPLLFH